MTKNGSIGVRTLQRALKEIYLTTMVLAGGAVRCYLKHLSNSQCLRKIYRKKNSEVQSYCKSAECQSKTGEDHATMLN